MNGYEKTCRSILVSRNGQNEVASNQQSNCFHMLILSSPTPYVLPCFSHGSGSRLQLTTTPAFQLRLLSNCSSRSSLLKTCATLDEKDADSSEQPSPLLQQGQSNRDVEKSVEVLKNAAKTRKVPATDVLAALSVIEKAKLDPSEFLPTLGGSESPGRTWMLVFTAEKQYKGGRYFPITAVQRFDAAGSRIENGVFLGPIGSLTFEGRFSWKKRILAFVFERIKIKIGPLKPLEVSLGKGEDREPNNKDPFFIWFYIDEEIAVARGKSGGTAFWCRCQRVNNP